MSVDQKPKKEDMKRGSVSGLTTMCMAMVVAGLVGVANAAIAAQTIPESGAMVLLGSGLVGLAAWGRKKYRK
jgi:hypothetical protein